MKSLSALTTRAVVFASLLAATACSTIAPRRIEKSFTVSMTTPLPERSAIEAGIIRYRVHLTNGDSFITTRRVHPGDTLTFVYLDYSESDYTQSNQ